MSNPADFVAQVADAYKHLYDLLYLRTHPLLDVLVPDQGLTRKQRARRLHSILLDAVGELNPDMEAPVFSHVWRRHRLMVLRYVNGLSPPAVADQLAVSLRQFYRLHKMAIEDVAGILRDRYIERRAEAGEAMPSAGKDTRLSRLELLRLEVARMSQAHRFGRVEEVIQGALPLIREILFQHRLGIDLALAEPLPSVSVNRSLLRQLLLGLLDFLIEHAEEATIRLTAQAEESAVCLQVSVFPPQAIRPAPAPHVQQHLAALEEMAQLSGARLTLIHSDQAISGFRVHLPTAERTILVVDDNVDVLDLFRGYLSAHHFRVATAQTVPEALDLASRLQPYAITLDLMMPDQDGWDLLQMLLNRADTRHIPVIVCSVLKQKELALSLGATAFLEKPVTEHALISALDALAENRSDLARPEQSHLAASGPRRLPSDSPLS